MPLGMEIGQIGCVDWARGWVWARVRTFPRTTPFCGLQAVIVGFDLLCHQPTPLGEELLIVRSVHLQNGFGDAVLPEILAQDRSVRYIAIRGIARVALLEDLCKIHGGSVVPYGLVDLRVQIGVVCNLIVFRLLANAAVDQIGRAHV